MLSRESVVTFYSLFFFCVAQRKNSCCLFVTKVCPFHHLDLFMFHNLIKNGLKKNIIHCN